MASNLPTPLTYEQSTALRARLFDLADKFARELDIHPAKVELELGFICAHYAAHKGVLDGKYKEWLDARKIPQADQPAGTPEVPDGGR